MKNLVTGGAGFIGSHLVDRLLEDGVQVTVFDDFSTGRKANIAHQVEQSGLTVVAGTILDPAAVEQAMEGADTVYHLAAAVGVKHVVDNPLRTLRTNVRGTEIVVEAAAKQGARVMLASTSEIYGMSEDLPFREDGPRVLGPTWSHRWSYSTSKALDEHLAFALREHGLQMSIVRYFNIFGPRMDPLGYGSVIARFVSQAVEGEPLTVHGDGRQSRAFTHVSEAVEATILAATEPAAEGQVFNVGSRFEHSVEDLALRIISMTGSSSTIEHVPYEVAFGVGFEDTRRRVPDITKIESVLGWRAQIDLNAGLRGVIEERGGVPCAS